MPSPLVQNLEQDVWPTEADLKFYPHFDRRIRAANIIELVTDPVKVAQNTFFPFLQYAIKFKRFGGRNGSGNPLKRKPKERIIRYAARRDAYIYAYYRRLIMEHYEKELIFSGISDNVIAYRKIPVTPGSKSGKSNIHFANEAFEEIKRRQACLAVALDISSFFESLDHGLLYARWAKLLGADTLPADHKAVFRSLTNYAYVDRDKCYKRLGYITEIEVEGRKISKLAKHIPYKLCSRKDFINLIVAKGHPEGTLIKQNKDLGIPQGSPISDLLANLYLLDFDRALQKYADSIGAYYRRYSDDILFICDQDETILDAALKFIQDQITEAGSGLAIKPEKTNITSFGFCDGLLKCSTVKSKHPSPADVAEKPFEYLGFSFDGQSKLIRNNTMSNYYRKIAANCQAYAYELVKRYPCKPYDYVWKRANLPRFYQRFGKVEEFEEKCIGNVEKWTFLTYADKAAKIMEQPEIMRQLKRRNKIIEKRLKEAILKQL